MFRKKSNMELVNEANDLAMKIFESRDKTEYEKLTKEREKIVQKIDSNIERMKKRR